MAESAPKKGGRLHKKRYSIIISNPLDALKIKARGNHLALYSPELKDIKDDIQKGLETNYKNVEVKILDKCPDLNTEFLQKEDNKRKYLAASGICGSTRIADVGGLPYLYNKSFRDKSECDWEIHNIIETCGMKQESQPFVFGSANADIKMSDTGGEVIINEKVGVVKHNRLCEIGISKTVDMNKAKAVVEPPKDKDKDKEETKSSEVSTPTTTRVRGASLDVATAAADDKKEITEANDDKKEKENKKDKADTPQVKVYYSSSIGCRANLFLCDGKNDEPVIYIKASVRTGQLSITNCIREALKKVKGVEKATQIGMGGIIRVNNGKVKAYIMPEYVDIDYKDNDAIAKSRKTVEIGPNLLMYSNFLTDDPSENGKYHFTLESTICQGMEEHSQHDAGVFIETCTNDTIEYEGYFTLAKYIYRIEDAYHNIEAEKK